MKNKAFLILLAVVLAISLSLIGCAGGEEEEEEEPEVIELIFSDYTPPDDPSAQATTAYANYIADHSEGKIEIERIGYSGEILLYDEVFEGVQNGTADCATYVPDIGDGLQYIQVMQMPFMGWGTQRNAVSIFWQLADDYPEILGQFPSTLTFDTLYMMMPYHLHWTAANTNVITPQDAAGLDVRALEGNLADICTLAGMTASVVPFADLWSVFGSASPPAGFAQHAAFCYRFGLLPYFHSHTLFPGGITMTPRGMLWNTESYNAVVQAVGEEVMDAARAVWLETSNLWDTVHIAGALEWWVTHGDTVTSLDATQTKVWADAVTDYVTEWENSCDDPELAEDIYDAAKAYIAAPQT